MKDYQQLKKDENSRLSLNWNLNREIAKLNYRIHTDAIKDYLFGKTAKQWRDENPKKKGKSYNAILIAQGKIMSERIVLLRELAIKQMETLSLVSMDSIKQLPGGESE